MSLMNDRKHVQPIFIVGFPRSGTTLLTGMLAAHSSIAVGPETQFFVKLSPKQLTEAVNDPNWPEKASRHIKSITLTGEPVVKLYGLDDEALDFHLSNQKPSVHAMLEALTVTHARAKNKPRWAEKTPNHLLWLNTIRSLYPVAPIIRIVRDPRDSAMSLTKLPWASKSVLVNCYEWREWYFKSRDFFQTDSNSMTVIYEELIKNPLEILQKICNFIGENFEESMLNFQDSAREIMTEKESWKSDVTKSIDANRLNLWRRNMDLELAQAAGLICYEAIEEFKYESPVHPKKSVPVFPLNKDLIKEREKNIISAANHQILFYPTEKIRPHTLIIAFPEWGNTLVQRTKRLLLFLWKVLANRMSHRSIHLSNDIKLDGKIDTIAHFFLKILAKKGELKYL